MFCWIKDSERRNCLVNVRDVGSRGLIVFKFFFKNRFFSFILEKEKKNVDNLFM